MDDVLGVDHRAEYNARIVAPLVQWIVAEHGEEKAREIASASNVPFETLGSNVWISQPQFESFLDRTRALVPDDAAFKRVCVYRLSDGYGPMRYLLWATSPSAIYALAEKTYKLASTIGQPKVLSRTRTALSVRFTSDRVISRLNCLVRQAQTAEFPRLWGLPPATVRETSCIALGDEACEYHLRYYDRRGWIPTLVGVGLGAVAAAVAVRLGVPPTSFPTTLMLLGGALGFIVEQQRTSRANLSVGQEQNDALRALAEEEADARKELLALHQRQRDWSRMLEADARERALAIQGLVDRMHESHEARARKLRGVSHDLRSPLAVIQLGTEFLLDQRHTLGAEGLSVVHDIDESVVRMQALITELMQVTTTTTGATQLSLEPVDVADMCERLRRRVRAMVHGRDVRASVFKTREAPESIEIDPLLLDRITDNLLGNAAKYTERGSIVVEVDGSPGFLVLKISDSGRGIEPDAIEQAFRPGGSPGNTRAAGSYGLGLSVVVELLARIGGRLEVMSKPNVGTTFWVYLPVKRLAFSSIPPRASGNAMDDLMNKVVRIRRVKSA